MPITPIKQFTGNASLGADFQKQWAESASILSSKSRELLNNKQDAINRCLLWLRKGAEATSNERFIYRWVSLEALTGVLEQCGSTLTLVKSLISSKLRDDSAKTIFDRNKELVKQLEAEPLISWRTKQNRSKVLKEAIDALGKNGNYNEVIVKTALCIYEVRNKFLHWGEAKPLINGCNTLLRELIHALLKDLLQNIQD